MEITKIFTIETAHRARNAVSTKCSNIHGHTYQIELTIEGSPLNASGMVLDFTYLKQYIKPYIDAFDHCYLMAEQEDPTYRDFITKTTDRWILAPFNWSCENMAMLIFKVCDKILRSLFFKDGEKPTLVSVTVWETRTGKCTCNAKDVENYLDKIMMSEQEIKYSPEIRLELGKSQILDMLFGKTIDVPAAPKQIASPIVI